MHRSMTGSYVLVLELGSGVELDVGRLGRVCFPRGYYSYTGSAMGGLLPRVRRHLRGGRVMHWHIDHLLARARISRVLLLPSRSREECAVYGRLRRCVPGAEPVPRFGASDCRCPSHLLRHGDDPAGAIRNLLRAPGLDRILHEGSGNEASYER